MRAAFSVLYALVGALLLFMDLSSTGAATIDIRLFLGLAALLCLFAAWQGWFHGGAAWRAIHVLLGVGVVGTCLVLWVVALLLFQDKQAWLAPQLALIAAGILTIPACGYLISLVGWTRASKAAHLAAARPSAAPVSAAAETTAPAAAHRPGPAKPWRYVGLGLGLVAVVAVVAWARFGSDWRCAATDPQSCYRAAEAAVRRGDLPKAVAFYERVIPAELGKQSPASQQAAYAWHARNEILVRLDDRQHLSGAILEACPRLVVSCEDLVKTLTKGNYLPLAEEAWRSLCQSGSEDACGDYGQWLVETKGSEPGMAALQSYCASASMDACRRLGVQLRATGRAGEAREPLLRSCRLSLAAKKSGHPPKTALCQFVIRVERSTVSREQWLDDIRSVCAEDIDECPGVSMDVDRPTFRQINEEACRVHGLEAKPGSYAYCSPKEK